MSALVEVQEVSESLTIIIHNDGRNIVQLMNDLLNIVRPRYNEGKDIFIDLRNVNYMAPHIIGVLGLIHRDLEQKGAHLKICNANEIVAEVLRKHPQLSTVLVHRLSPSHFVKD